MSTEEPNPYAPPPEDGRGTKARGFRGRGSSRMRPAQPPPPPPPPGGTVVEGRRALWLALLGAVLLAPLVWAAIPLGIAGLVLGIRALRAASRQRGTAPGAVPAVVVGAVVTLLGLAFGALTLVFAAEIRENQECRAGANTEVARQACAAEFERATQARLPGWVAR